MKELDPNPESTWGASAEYKERWNKEYGETAPKGNASKAEWVEFAQKFGTSAEDAEAMTVAELKETYGDKTPGAEAVAPGSSANEPAPGGGTDSGTPAGTAGTTSTPRASASGATTS